MLSLQESRAKFFFLIRNFRKFAENVKLRFTENLAWKERIGVIIQSLVSFTIRASEIDKYCGVFLAYSFSYQNREFRKHVGNILWAITSSKSINFVYIGWKYSVSIYWNRNNMTYVQILALNHTWRDLFWRHYVAFWHHLFTLKAFSLQFVIIKNPFSENNSQYPETKLIVSQLRIQNYKQKSNFKIIV